MRLCEPYLIHELNRSLEHDAISVTAYLNQADQEPYLMLRSFYQGHRWFSARPVGELLIQRNHSAVELRRWSHSEEVSKLWASFYFITWEGMTDLGIPSAEAWLGLQSG